MYTFWLSITHHQIVRKKTERYTFTTMIVSLTVENTVEKFLTFYLLIKKVR